MSTSEYQFHIFGISSNDVTIKDEFREDYDEAELFQTLMGNGTVSHLGLDFATTGDYNEGNYIGCLSSPAYPWGAQDSFEGCLRTPEEVKKAIVAAIGKYVEESPDEIAGLVDYETANGCYKRGIEMDKKYVWLVICEWHNTDPKYFIFASEKGARERLRELIEEYGVDEYGECEDEDGRTVDECVRDGMFYPGGGGDFFFLQKTELEP